jgi:oxygen-independent coproporphyrinogen-3 oxidase
VSSLYLHIPFCERKCIYCDFYSVETLSQTLPFLSALRAEIDLYASYAGEEEVKSMYFGGGTPSLLDPDQIEAILGQLQSLFRISHGAEVTVETNPGTVTRQKLLAYRRLGVNRLSIGIQSFHERDLQFLGRIHNSDQAVRCISDARAAGFDNVSIDLIYSLPGQTPDAWHDNLRRAVEFEPEHVSAYTLIVEDNTPLAHMVATGLVTPNPVGAEAELYAMTIEFMESSGFDHYEVSNYARAGFHSRHNSAYWTHANYLGFGPSAHSFWKGSGASRGRRWANIANVSTYIERSLKHELPVVFEEAVTPNELVNERIFLGLRSTGLDFVNLRKEFGVDLLADRSAIVRGMVEERLANIENGLLRLTPKGFLLCDEIAGRLMV